MADKKITMIYGFLTSLASKVTCMFRGQSTDVQSALDSIGAYSTNEEMVGTWIDGKPVYRSILYGVTGSVAGVNANVIDLSALDIDHVVNMVGWVTDASGTQLSIQTYLNQTTYIAFTYNKVQNALRGNTSEHYVNLPVELIIEYTKTTD